MVVVVPPTPRMSVGDELVAEPAPSVDMFSARTGVADCRGASGSTGPRPGGPDGTTAAKTETCCDAAGVGSSEPTRTCDKTNDPTGAARAAGGSALATAAADRESPLMAPAAGSAVSLRVVAA